MGKRKSLFLRIRSKFVLFYSIFTHGANVSKLHETLIHFLSCKKLDNSSYADYYLDNYGLVHVISKLKVFSVIYILKCNVFFLFYAFEIM